MITMIRKSFKTKIYKVILWITLLATAGVFTVLEMGRSYFFGGGVSSGWILQVNSRTFTAPEFARAVADQEERMRMLRAQYGQFADVYMQMLGMSSNPQFLALNALMRRALLDQEAARLALHISDEKAQASLSDIMFVYQELSDVAPLFTWDHSLGGINPLALTEYHRRSGISTAEFAAQIKDAVQRDMLKKLVEHSIYLPKFELKQKFEKIFLSHKFSIATISEAQILNRVKKEPVSDDSLKSYYELANAQEKRYYVPEKRAVKIVAFEPSQYGVWVTSQDIEQYYNNNKARYVEQPAQVQVRHILLADKDANKAEKLHAQLIEHPEKFTALAKEHSADAKTAAQGGLMPYFSKGTHEKSFERAAFTLPKEGDISAVIKTDQGYEIVQLVHKKAQLFKPLTQVSAEIKTQLLNKKFQEQFTTDMRAAIGSPAALQKLAKEKQGKDQGAVEVTSSNSVLSKTAFRLQNHETSYYHEGNQGMLVTVLGIKESFAPPLEQIKARVTQDYYADAAKKELANILDAIQKTGSINAYKDLVVFEKTGFLRHSQEAKDEEPVKQALIKRGFDLGKMFQLENKGGLSTYERNGSGYIIRLDEIAPFDATLFEQKKKELMANLLQEKKSLSMAGFVASLYRNAKINKNESLIRTEQ